MSTFRNAYLGFAIDEPSLDESTNMYAVQLNLLVSDGGKKAGALTLTLKIPRDGGR